MCGCACVEAGATRSHHPRLCTCVRHVDRLAPSTALAATLQAHLQPNKLQHTLQDMCVWPTHPEDLIVIAQSAGEHQLGLLCAALLCGNSRDDAAALLLLRPPACCCCCYDVGHRDTETQNTAQGGLGAHTHRQLPASATMILAWRAGSLCRVGWGGGWCRNTKAVFEAYLHASWEEAQQQNTCAVLSASLQEQLPLPLLSLLSTSSACCWLLCGEMLC